MEEDRQYIRGLILESKQFAIELYDKTLNEFDELKLINEKTKRNYHGKDSYIKYRRNLGVILCEFKKSSNFVLNSIKVFHRFLNLKIEKGIVVKEEIEKYKKRVLEVNCKRTGEYHERLSLHGTNDRNNETKESSDSIGDGTRVGNTT